MWTSLNNGDGTFGTAREGLHALCLFQGWQADRHPRFLADVTGDGRADIVGFGDQGVQVARGRGDGTFDPPTHLVSFFGRQAMPDLEWHVGRDPRLLADLTGSGAMDVVGFGDDGIWVLVLDTTGPESPQFCVPDLGYDTGWREGKHHRLAADLHRRRPGRPDRLRRRGGLRLSQRGHRPGPPADPGPLRAWASTATVT